MQKELLGIIEDIMNSAQQAFPDAETNPPSIEEATEWFIQELAARTEHMGIPPDGFEYMRAELLSASDVQEWGAIVGRYFDELERAVKNAEDGHEGHDD